MSYYGIEEDMAAEAQAEANAEFAAEMESEGILRPIEQWTISYVQRNYRKGNISRERVREFMGMWNRGVSPDDRVTIEEVT